MIVEHEFLEQISEDDWPLARCLEFIGRHKDPWPVLQGLHADGCIALRRGAAAPLPDWQADAIFRTRDLPSEALAEAGVPDGSGVFVTITERGVGRAFS